MKPNFARLALLGTTVLLSAACSRLESQKTEVIASAPAPKVYSATEKIDGVWKGPCLPNEAALTSQTQIKIANGIMEVEQTRFLDTSCGERGMTVRTTFTAVLGAEREIPVGSNDLDLVSQKIQYIVESDLIANLWTSQKWCGLEQWKMGESIDVASKTCGALELPATGFSMKGIVSADPNKVLFNEGFKGVPTEDLLDRVTTLQTNAYLKQ